MQSHNRSRCVRIAAASMSIAAIAAPAASAVPVIDPPAVDQGAAGVVQGAPAVVVSAPDDGFDWGSAGIGAAAGAGLVLVGAGSFAMSHKARVRLAR